MAQGNWRSGRWRKMPLTSSQVQNATALFSPPQDSGPAGPCARSESASIERCWAEVTCADCGDIIHPDRADRCRGCGTEICWECKYFIDYRALCGKCADLINSDERKVKYNVNHCEGF